jgi:hypothetical protein
VLESLQAPRPSSKDAEQQIGFVPAMAVAGSEAAAWIRKQARCPASQAMIKPRNQRWPFKKNAPELEGQYSTLRAS